MARRGSRKETTIDELSNNSVDEVIEETPSVEVKEINHEFGRVTNCISLNLRQDASTNSIILEELPVNTKLEIVDDSDVNFYKVVAPNKKTGFVMKDYITKIGK